MIPKDKRTKVAVAACGSLLAGIVLFASCGACGRSGRSVSPSEAARGDGGEGAEAQGAPRSEVELRAWEFAAEGEEEDLATLAVREGAAGLVEAARDPSRRATAIAAMGHARGWAQLPFLADAALAKDDGEAASALASVVALAARSRRSEDEEDAAELAEGCAKLAALARAEDRPRERRVPALRALRMMPCPAPDGGLPTDLDTK